MLYNAVQKQLGSVPNLFKTIAQSHAALTGYLQQTASLANGVLNPQLREQIALVTAGKNQCNYCASAHSLLGKMAGIDEQERARNLHGKSGNTKTQAALDFSASIVDKRGKVSDDDLTNIRNVKIMTSLVHGFLDYSVAHGAMRARFVQHPWQRSHS